MNHAGANTQGGQHGQAIPGQYSRVRNDTLRTPQDNGRREEDETQAQNEQSQIPVAPYTRNAYAGTLPEGTCRDMNWHNFAQPSLGDDASHTNNTTNSSRDMHMTNPTRGYDDDNAVFLAPPYAHDLSVYELQSSTAPMPDDLELLDDQEFFDMAYAEIQATSDDLRSYDALPDPVLEYFCSVGNCPRRDRPFRRRQEYMRHISRSNDPAHARLRAAIRNGGV